MSPQPGDENLPRPGDLLYIGRQASVQFAREPFLFRVIRVDPRPTYTGWAWLNGYQLDEDGYALVRRDIFVIVAGLVPWYEASSQDPTPGCSGLTPDRGQPAGWDRPADVPPRPTRSRPRPSRTERPRSGRPG
jgi:hypothetical protein